MHTPRKAPKPRKPEPFFRKQRGLWYVQIKGRQVNLGSDKKAAFEQYHKLMAGQADFTSDTTVVAVLTRFLEWTKSHRARATFDWYANYLLSFGEYVGERKKVKELKAHHVTEWADSHGWDGNTRYAAIRTVKRAFNWAVDEEHLTVSPVRNVKRGRPERREVVITSEQWQQILAAVNDSFRDLVVFMRQTGCRPQEARILEARHYDKTRKLFLIPADEAKGSVPRLIYLNDAALEIVLPLVAKYPAGALFRNSRREAWSKNAIMLRFRRLAEKLEIKGLVAYAIRHTFATEALTRGVDSLVVAQLMGHKDVKMLAERYQHLAKNPTFLRDAANAATASPVPEAQPESLSKSA